MGCCITKRTVHEHNYKQRRFTQERDIQEVDIQLELDIDNVNETGETDNEMDQAIKMVDQSDNETSFDLTALRQSLNEDG